MKKYNWAIVGTGWAASDMADALNKENGDDFSNYGNRFIWN